MTIFRPSVVVGDSQTGETAKYDGIYYLILYLRRWPQLLRQINVGNDRVRLNFVPVDFVVESLAVLSLDEKTKGKTIALADPAPLTTAELFDLIAEKLSGKLSSITPPPKLVEVSLSTPISPPITGLPLLRRALFFLSQTYDTQEAEECLLRIMFRAQISGITSAICSNLSRSIRSSDRQNGSKPVFFCIKTPGRTMGSQHIESLSYFCCFGAFAALSFAQSGRVQPTPTPTPDDDPIKVETEEVKVNLLAFDETGMFFPGVTEKDVVVSENNILHQPTTVRRIPANVLIVMDTGGEMRWVKTLDQTRKVARAVVNALRPEDSVAILQYADKAVIASEWTTDRELTNAAIGRTKFGISLKVRRRVETCRVNFYTSGDLENKHLVLITDGTDSEVDLRKKNEAMRKLLSTDIAVHVLSYAQMEATDIEPRTKGITKTPPPKAMPAGDLGNTAKRSPRYRTGTKDRPYDKYGPCLPEKNAFTPGRSGTQRRNARNAG